MRAMLLCAILGSVVIGLPPARANEVLDNPDPSTVLLLQYKLSRTTPPYDALAQADNSVRSADEFHRSELMKRIEASLQTKMASLEGVKEITLRLNSHFAEYDAQYGEYDFDINDGTYVPYNVLGRQVRIALTNGTKAQVWKLSSKDAEEALRKNKNDRLAALILTLAVTDSRPAVEGEPLILNARIIRYDVMTGYGNVKLGSVVVENSP